jgi:hypothetical protein
MMSGRPDSLACSSVRIIKKLPENLTPERERDSGNPTPRLQSEQRSRRRKKEAESLSRGRRATKPSRRSHTSPVLLPSRRRLSGPPDVRAARGEGGGEAFLLLPRHI